MITLAEIKNSVQAVRNQYQARIQKNIDANSLPPTIDANGRYHAPCDGYQWFEQTFLGGQYLPENEYYTKPDCTVKLKINFAVIDELSAFLNGSHGKTWEQNGMTICYFYASVTKAEKSALLKILPENGKKIVLTDENYTGNNKTWIFKTSKFTRKFANLYGHNWQDIFMMMEWEFAPGVEFKLIDKKGKQTFISDFDNKLVRYEYSDNIISF